MGVACGLNLIAYLKLWRKVKCQRHKLVLMNVERVLPVMKVVAEKEEIVGVEPVSSRV